MEGKPIGWVLVLVTLTAIPLALFGLETVLDRVSGVSGTYLAWAFLVPVFAICAYTIGVIIEERREYERKATSDYRQGEYKKKMSSAARRGQVSGVPRRDQWKS